MSVRRLTMAQALVEYLSVQSVERDGEVRRFFGGVFGIFGHGNVAGVGQALQQCAPGLRYYQTRNEQAMVHTAAGFAKMNNRLRAMVCTTSIGPGATNLVTGAAGATINRLPVLLLPGDAFASRRVGAVLQQLEDPACQDNTVNDCLRPVSRYWDRMNRPEQLVSALPAAMRVLTSPSETGAVTLALPQDVQAEAFDYPEELFSERVWHVPRTPPEEALVSRAVELIRGARRPLIVAGGGVIYSEAEEALALLAQSTGIPVVETQAGKGSLPFDHPMSLGAIGVTGTPGANLAAREADLVLGVGTRYSDFTTASRTAFQHPEVGFINVNVTGLDAAKHAGLMLIADARESLCRLADGLSGHRVDEQLEDRIAEWKEAWERETARLFDLGHGPPVSQSEVIGAVDRAAGPRDVVVCAAGSLPGDLHKLWRPRDSKGYHLEYGYSCMGYEIAGGLGVKLADPSREVFVMVGDGSYLMMAQEIVTSVQEGIKLLIVLLDNRGYSSIGGLSKACGCGGFGTQYRYRRAESQALDGDPLPVDLAANAESLGAALFRATDRASLEEALARARKSKRTAVVAIQTDPDVRVPGYESWWDVPVAEVSTMEGVRQARRQYERDRRWERHLL